MSDPPVENTQVIERHPDTLLSVEDFCEWTGVSKRTFVQWCQDGNAPKRIKFGRHVRIRWSDALAWAEARYVTD